MQTIDFVALATRVTGGVEGIRACLVQSREGLTLGVYPPEAEGRARDAWGRLQALGDAQRGFVDLAEEIVVVARRGPYVALALAAPDVRPGLVLDALDSTLRAAEGDRSRTVQADDVPTPRSTPIRRRRPTRHPDATKRGQPREIQLPAEELAKALEEAMPAEAAAGVPEPAPESTEAPMVVEVPEPPEEGPRPEALPVDRASLAREFGRLFADQARGED